MQRGRPHHDASERGEQQLHRAASSVIAAARTAAALTAMDAECAELLVQVRAFDAERLRGARDVPVELGEPNPNELRLHFFAELAQALARIAAEIDRGDRSGVTGAAGLTGRARSTEVGRQILFANHFVAHDDEPLDDVAQL